MLLAFSNPVYTVESVQGIIYAYFVILPKHISHNLRYVHTQ